MKGSSSAVKGSSNVVKGSNVSDKRQKKDSYLVVRSWYAAAGDATLLLLLASAGDWLLSGAVLSDRASAEVCICNTIIMCSRKNEAYCALCKCIGMSGAMKHLISRRLGIAK